MPILTARNLSKAYGARPLFTGATFTLRRGEKAALLGVNGTGKSTLLRVLAGLEPADGGSVEQRRDTTILYLPQEPELAPERTARQIVQEGLAAWHAVKEEYDLVTEKIGNEGHEDLALLTRQAALGDSLEHHGGWSRDHEVDEMLGHLGIDDRDRPVGTMSGGERRRVALARLLVARPDLAILDEPTNHLDADTIAWLEEHLRDVFPGAVLIVTHDRYVLDAVATRIFELENGNLTEFTKRSDALGAYADFLEQRADRDAHEERTESNRQNLIRREIEWLRRGPKARSTKQKARIQRAEAVIGESGPQRRGQVELSGLEDGAKRLGGTILECRDLCLDLGGRRLIDHLTLSLVRGDRVGIVGPNGAGKTTLLRAVTGELTPTSGSVVRGAQTKIAFFDQARTSLKDDWTVFENVAEREGADRTGAGAVTIGDRTLELRAYLELFLFDGNALRRKVSALSGGERARVALALALKTGANVLLLDEPTNDLDIATLSALEELLESWPGCALIVSHDRWFLDRVATSILAFEGNGKCVLYGGNWSDYRERRLAAPAPGPKIVELPAGATMRAPPPAPVAPEKKLSFAERLELEKILDVIAAAEVKVAELEAKLAALYTKAPDQAERVRNEGLAAQAEVTRLVQRWEELEARKG